MHPELVACVPSSRYPDVIYRVFRDPHGAWRCECPGFGFRQRCRHITTLATLGAVPIARRAADAEADGADCS